MPIMMNSHNHTKSGCMSIVLLMPVLVASLIMVLAVADATIITPSSSSSGGNATNLDEPHGTEEKVDVSVVVRRSLLPGGTYIEDEEMELWSHVVLIRTPNDGVGTGLLLKKNYVLTSHSVVKTYIDPFEFTIHLGQQVSNAFQVFIHPHEDLAVLKIHPPMKKTTRLPAPHSPKGFFWPISQQDPKPNSTIKLYGYGSVSVSGSGSGSPSSSSASHHHHGIPSSSAPRSHVYLTSKLISVTDKPYLNLPHHPHHHHHHHHIRTKSTISITSEDVGGPGFLSHGNVVGGILIPSRKSPGQGELMSLAHTRDWVFDAMKTSCNREEQVFSRMSIGKDPDVLVYYHCMVDRAEELRVYLHSKPSCNSKWKAVVITNAYGKVLGMVSTHPKRNKDKLIMTGHSLKSTEVFHIELWKSKFHGIHTKMATYGPFHVEDFIDGGLHFEWCEG